MESEEKIDLVITWVDGKEKKWVEKIKKYSENYDEKRYRDYDLLKYWFRSIEENLPWFNKIFFITDNQKPKWLNESNRLKIVNHKDFIPEKFLPTFNSNVIELNLFRIKELSNKFILFNDDMFVLDKMLPSDFFDGEKIKSLHIYSSIIPTENFSHILLNNLIIINSLFSKRKSLKKNFKSIFSFKYKHRIINTLCTLPWKSITGYYISHLPVPHIKKEFNNIYNKNKKEFERTFEHKFRDNDDINHWLITQILMEEGKSSPQNINIGKLFTLKEADIICKTILKANKQMICINDQDISDKEFNIAISKIQEAFQKKYKNKSSFERY